MQMTVEIGGRQVRLELSGKDEHELARHLLAAPEVAAELRRTVALQGYRVFEPVEDEGLLRQYAVAFTEGGRDTLLDAIVHSFGGIPQEAVREAAHDPELSELIDLLVEGVHEADPSRDTGFLAGELRDQIEEQLADLLSEVDESTPMDALASRRARVEMAFVPGLHEKAIDDLHVRHGGYVFGPETADPGGLAGLFEFLNVDPKGFVAWYRENREVDLLANLDWTPSETPGQDDFRSAQARERAEGWRDLIEHHAPDLDRPALSTFEDVANILENAGYGGVPVFVARVPLKELVEADPSMDLVFEDGGFVGLHDFLNGSGYIETPRAPVRIRAGEGSWYVANVRKDAIDDVYGIVGRYYEAKMRQAAPEPWNHREADFWQRDFSTEPYLYAVVERRAEGVFEAQTFDGRGHPAGPLSEPRRFADLPSAKAEIDALAQFTPQPAPDKPGTELRI